MTYLKVVILINLNRTAGYVYKLTNLVLLVSLTHLMTFKPKRQNPTIVGLLVFIYFLSLKSPDVKTASKQFTCAKCMY